MRFTTHLFSGALLTITALAAPLTSQRQARHEARRLAQGEGRLVFHQSHPPYQPGTTDVLRLNTTAHQQFSSNWAGAVLIGTDYTTVTAEFIVPSPKVPPGSSSTKRYCASAWVGIDGDTCTSAILQAGVDFCIQGNSSSYDAWYEWYPDYAHDFSGISVSAGDVIRVTVDAISKTAGTATIKNVFTGQSVTHTFTGAMDGDLCEYNAEWIVEDFELGGSLVPFVDFGTVTFTGTEATDAGAIVGPSGAALIDIKQNNRVLTSSSVTANSVTVKYVR